MKHLLLWLALCTTALADGLEIKVGVPGPIVAHLTLPEAGEHSVSWASDEGTKFLPSRTGRELHVWGTAGAHWIEASGTTAVYAERDILVPGPTWATDKTDIKLEKLKYLVDKNAWRFREAYAVGPTPPPVPPVPPTPVPVPGKRAFVVVRESADTVPSHAALLTSLRTGEAAKFFGDRLFILDDDDLPAKLRTIQLGTLPTFVVLDDAGTVVHQEPLPATAALIVAAAKGAGG